VLSNVPGLANTLQSISTSPILSRFTNVRFLSVRDIADIDDGILRELSSGKVLPDLAYLDVSGCQKMSSNGVRALVKGKGVGFKGFAQNCTRQHRNCNQMQTTPATIKHVALATNLLSLSLTLPSKFRASHLSPLNGHKTLRSLAIYFEGFTHVNLPLHLPALRDFLLLVGEWTHFDWASCQACAYPELRCLTIHDRQAHPAQSLSMGHLTAWTSLHLTQLQQLCFLQIGRTPSELQPFAPTQVCEQALGNLAAQRGFEATWLVDSTIGFHQILTEAYAASTRTSLLTSGEVALAIAKEL
jgi:hypothetical protein